MDDIEIIEKYYFCRNCLKKSDETKLQIYEIVNEELKRIFQVEHLALCYMCKRRAQQAEAFINNVQHSQTFFESIQNGLNYSKQLPSDQLNLVTCLSNVTLNMLDAYEFTEDEDYCKVKVELQLKEEESHGRGYNDHDGDMSNDQFDLNLKEELDEDEYPLTKLKEELELEGIKIQCLKKTVKTKIGISKKKKQRNKAASDDKLTNEDDFHIETVYISREECMKERNAMVLERKYLDATYKCESCIKGFTIKLIYDKHMERHSEKKGEHECDICKQRFGTEDKLNLHQRYHKTRYRCTVCGLTRVAQLTIKDHYTAFHCNGTYQFPCKQCTKTFKRQSSLRKHAAYAHGGARVSCGYCDKTYRSKEALKSHLTRKHPTEVSAGAVPARHACAECGAAFCAPSQLRKHATKHSQRRDYYCVECDKSFKSDAILKQHLKTAMPHMNYSELPLACQHCEKRFAIKRDLDRHTNRVHLNIKPFQCDKCDRAYINSWSLREHHRLSHEGYKRPLRFPCTMCDKIFDRKQILQSHIRTHTGERPYACARCPAQFAQRSVLGTHVRLVHLRLARDGRPRDRRLQRAPRELDALPCA